MTLDEARASDRHLVARCVGDALDREAWEAFVARYRPHVVRAAAITLSRQGHMDPTLAEDVAADVFSALLTNRQGTLGRFEWRSSLVTWLAVVTRRQAGKTLRRVRPATRLPSDEDLCPSGASPAPALEAERAEAVRVMRAHLGALPPRDQLALRLFYEGERTYAEVAEVVGVPPAHVSSLLARAKAKLANALARGPLGS
jgi:RNA polymerase sigma-70 factor (ECF subfamily)